MRRNRRRPFNEEKETRKIVVISLSVLIIAVLAFVITFVVYSNYLEKGEDIAEFKSLPITELGKTNQESSYQEASSSIGKTVNELQEEKNEIANETNVEKIAINTSNMEKQKVEKIEEKKEQETSNNTVKTEEKVEDPTFAKPVEGEVIAKFAKDTLIYSNTLQEWVTHNGMDIKADKTTVVKASAEGTIKSIKNDPRYGLTIILAHEDVFKTVYSNLQTAEFVQEGQVVEKGKTIASVGENASFEIAEGAHLHFEMTKDGEKVNPTIYWNK